MAFDRNEALGRVNMFEGLAPRALSLVASLLTEESHGTGAVLFRAGDPGDKLFFIVEGRVRIVRQIAGMGEEALAVLGPGDYFGEMSLVDDAERSADAIVHESCTLLTIPREKMQELLFLHKDVAYEILWNVVRTLSQRLREANEKLTMLASSGRFGG